MRVGQHEMVFEAPDLVVFRIKGNITSADADILSHAVVEAGHGGTAYLMSVIVAPGFAMSGDARRRFVEVTRGLPVLVDAVVGADFRTRVIARLVEGITRVLSKMTLRIYFYNDEASARASLCNLGCVACGATPKQV